MLFVPFSGDVAGLDLVQLILDALLGSDLSVQGRLQLQTGRHVQLSEAPHLPRHVLQQQRKNICQYRRNAKAFSYSTVHSHSESLHLIDTEAFHLAQQVLQYLETVFVFHRGSCSQAGVPQPLQLFCHLGGQSLQVASSILLITHPVANAHKYTYLH